MPKLLEKIAPVTLQIKAIPKSWVLAAGLAVKKKKALERHLKIVRNDWVN